MSRARRFLVGALVVGVSAMAAGSASWSAFSSSASSASNTFQAGTVAISHNSGSGVLLALTNALPGDTTSGCTKVSYSGSLSATVRMFATTTGDLDDYLTLKVTRGTIPSDAVLPTCVGFTADSRDYVGKGNGVVYEGDLAAFAASYATASPDPDASTGGTEDWTTAESHVYKLEVTLQNDAAAQGLSSTASFTWEARNQ